MPAEVLTNLESIGDLVGAYMGIAEGIDEDMYIEGLIKQAHGHAANVFNLDAAATAKTGRLSHVYEFGVAGITPGQGSLDPLSPEGRLWTHEIVGHGGSQDIFFNFRPALQRNPQPTTQSTGVPSKYLAKLSRRKYVFWNKAYVIESGETVSVKSDRGDNGFLFVPFYGQPGGNSRGYMMWNSRMLGPLTIRPGRSSKGSFTQFWLAWWAESGSEIMYRDMMDSVDLDIARTQAEIAKRAQAEAMKPPMNTNIVGAAAESRGFFSKLFKAAAAKRRGTKTV